MSKLSDAPELRAAFNKAANDFGLSDHEFSRGIAEYFFIAGRESAFEEAKETIYRHGIKYIEQARQMSEKPKRTIAQLQVSSHGTIIVMSNDGKLFAIRGLGADGLPEWLPYPDLPQES